MKKALKSLFLVFLSSALLMNFASCSDDGSTPSSSTSSTPESDNGTVLDASTIPTLALGAKFPYTDWGEESDGKEYDYEVIHNSFLAETSASANVISRSARASTAAAWETTDRYQNDDVMFAKVKEYTNLTEYLVLYEITQARDGTMTGVSDLKDKYIFLNANGEKLLTFAFRWSSTYLLSNAKIKELQATEYKGVDEKDIRNAEWNKMTEAEIRDRAPERFKLMTTKAFSSDVTKQFYLDVSYNRKDDDSIDYLDETTIDKKTQNHFIELNGEFVSPYKTIASPNDSSKGTVYELLGKGGTFCSFETATSTKNNTTTTTYTLKVKGNGTFAGEKATEGSRVQLTDGLSYKKVSIKTDKTYPAYEISGSMVPGKSHESGNDGNGSGSSGSSVTGGVTVKKQTEKGGSWTELVKNANFSALSEYGIDFITFSEAETKFTVDGDTSGVPSVIYVGCPRYTGELAPYAKFPFANPKQDGETITWTPDVDSFLNTWIAAYKTFYGK